MSLIIKAARFAGLKHTGQFRKYAEPPIPYIVHPMRVAGLVTLYSDATEEEVAAAWLHDVVEDCGVTHQELVDRFGSQVANNVIGLTDISKQDPEIGKLNRELRKQANNEYLLKQPLWVQRIKLFDIADNIHDMIGCKDGFKFKFYREKRLQAALLRQAHPSLADEIVDFIDEELANP